MTIQSKPFNQINHREFIGGVSASALAAKDLGVRYIGVCCGGALHQVRAMAEALGKKVPASRYSPVIAKHAVLGSEDVARDYRTRYLKEHH